MLEQPAVLLVNSRPAEYNRAVHFTTTAARQIKSLFATRTMRFMREAG